jgi:hypothetical protein
MRNRHTTSTLKGLFAAALVAAAAASAPAQTASSTYRGAPRDPFVKYKPALKRKVEKKVATTVPVPDINARISKYKAQKLAAMNLQQAAPKPTTALTLSEVKVIGIFRTPRGYAAMVEATPIKLSYVVYPGEQFYDGMLVAIEESRLVFRKQTRWTDGRTDVAVETKVLVQPSAADALTAQRTEQPAPAEEKKTELTALVEALKALAASGAQQQQSQPQGGAEAPGANPQAKP